MQQSSVRLNKFISESGMCSRREADRYIESGVVFINGRKAIVGDQVRVGDRVQVNGKELEPRQADNIIFIALNKPVGVTSTTEEDVRDNIVQFVNHTSRIFPIGRLDKDSQGLIFLTNDGEMVNKISRAGNNHEKEYVVTVNKPLTPDVIIGMAKGVPMLGVVTKKCKLVQEGASSFRIVLVQGLNRQIRRMCAHFGYDVVKLERVRIMNITLKGLPVGDWRELTNNEMEEIHSLVETSTGEVEVKPKSKPAAKKFRPAGAQSAGPRTAGPKTAGPRTARPRKTGPKTAGPKTAGPRTAGPKTAGPRTAGPRTAGPKTAGPRTAGPRTAGPRTAGTGTARPKTAGPRTAGSSTAGSRNAGSKSTGHRSGGSKSAATRGEGPKSAGPKASRSGPSSGKTYGKSNRANEGNRNPKGKSGRKPGRR